ncbi:hypothetical protein DRE_00488 [Drechslerella stenobrocha 248]|uniref:Uncharacterized protein n=1 Tax=Drechslerella stenobrocha 248 TaxID=1043628 RepID=W7IEU3_9PEZI|nr:hypothetical protein DRE_00488 [Drechslerella stenobrocha 248]
MAATVTIASKTPTFVLEDIDTILEEIHCKNGYIAMTFISAQQRGYFKEAISGYEGFELVTSHATCNEAGGRALYRSSNAGISYTGYSTIIIRISPIKWSDCNASITFGKPKDKLWVLPQNRLRRRQEPLTSETPSSSETAPTATPTTMDSKTAKLFSFNKSAINRQLIPLTNSSIEQILSPIPEGFKLVCKNCTIKGNVDVISGVFNIRGGILSAVRALDDVAGSYIQLVTNDVFARVELETFWQGASAGAPAPPIRLAFLNVPTSGLNIAGLVSIGVFFTTVLAFEVSAKQDLQFDYGFEISVPNNSTATANLGNITQSSVTGFNETRFTVLPFGFQADNPTLTVSAALQPNIEVRIIFGDAIGAKAGVSIDVPKYSMEFAPLRGPVDSNCTEVTNRQPTEAEILLGAAGNITNIAPSYEIGAGFSVEFRNPKGNGKTVSWRAPIATFPAPTSCLAYVSGSGLVQATVLAASISSEISRQASLSSMLASMSGVTGTRGADTLASPTESAGRNAAGRTARNPLTRNRGEYTIIPRELSAVLLMALLPMHLSL